MSLLTQDQKDKIRATIRRVTDTFMVTPISIHHSVGVFDRFNEDRERVFENYTINGLAEEFTRKENWTNTDELAATDDSTIKVTINYEDMEDAGLADSNFRTIIDTADDFMTINGLRYQIKHAYLDGPLERKNCLVVLVGELEEAKQ